VPADLVVLEGEDLVDTGLRGDPHAAELENDIVTILERTLALDNVAYQEAAIHGVGTPLLPPSTSSSRDHRGISS
jgi:hypothetical protein